MTTTTTVLDSGTVQAIRDALSAAGVGKIADARRIGEAALARGGDVAALNAMLGTFCLRSDDFEGAVRHFRVANRKRPSDPVIALNLGTSLAELGLFAEVLETVAPELATSDPSGRLLRLRAYCAQSTGDFAGAITAYERVVAMFPDDWESWNNLGNSRRCAGDLGGAVEALERAASTAYDSPPVRLNLANALIEAGRSKDAESALRALAMDFPDDWRSLRELHVLLRGEAREEEALDAIEEASKRRPEDIELLLAVASQRLLLLDDKGAESAYAEVVRREPQHPDGNLGLAVAYELSNRVGELERLAIEAEARGVEIDVLSFIRAFVHRRAKRFQDGIDAMSEVSSELDSARHAQLLGQLYDGAGQYDEAWRSFSRMNEIHRADPSGPEERAGAYRASIARNLAMTSAEWASRWVDVEIGDGRASPVFLVGFPRSGTTLLDTILMTHSDVEVLEEEPTLHRVGEILGDYAALPELPAAVVAAARNAYFEAAAKYTPMAAGKIIVDKNPMFTVALPLIRRIFPDAKIVLAVRHPCDVALSCYTTNFKLNDGMSNFLRLDTTAELYDLAFAFSERLLSLLPMATHKVVYERLVADREDELKALFAFLGLPWDKAVLDHQKTAIDRGRIKTASYAQVVEPVYSRSSGRWRNYEQHLAPVLPVLKPWIEKFGYEAE